MSARRPARNARLAAASARVARALAAIPLVAAVSAVGAWTAAGHAPSSPACAAAAYTSRVALVVEHGNGQVIRLCIGFDGSSITGEQILQAARGSLEYATTGYGSLGDAVCQIDYEPASYPPSCWTSSSPYWAVFVSRGGGAWTGADRGVSSETYADGDAEGFRYDPQTGGAPPPASPAGTCPSGASVSPAAVATAAPPAPGAQSTAAPSRGGGAAANPPSTAATSAVPGGPPAAAVIPASPSAAPGRAPTGALAASTAPGIQPALVFAAALGGGLIGLVAVQIVYRRRRT